MTEGQYQDKFIEERFRKFPNNVFVPFLELKYNIGKYYKGKEFGMPDTIPDVIEFDENGDFHLWELKKLDNPEAWNGKFFGQLMLYNFLFCTEPWNELLGRFAMRNAKENSGIRGDIEKVLGHLAQYGEDEVAKDDDKNAQFKTWNLVVCGGYGFEIAAGVNPLAWSYLDMAESNYKKDLPEFNFHQFYSDPGGWTLITLPNASVYSGEGLTEYSIKQWEKENT
ncbi:MAG: hypothetical protein AAF688_15550 [Bacteroidota bacterium]